jgi:hypothetical protein
MQKTGKADVLTPAVYAPFIPAYERYKAQLGNPTREVESAGPLPELHVHEHATIFWSITKGFYILTHESRKWENRPDTAWHDRDTDWWSTKQVTKLFKKFNLPKGAKPPYGGLADRWYHSPEDWQWIGWMDWQCIFPRHVPGQNKIFIQEFEHGTLIGPLRKSAENNVAHIAVLMNDRPYELVNFDGEIPPCGTAEHP